MNGIGVPLLALALGGASDVLADQAKGYLLNGSDDLSTFLGNDPARLSYLIKPEQADLGLIGVPVSREPVGLIDSGINADHPQLNGKVLETLSVTDGPPEDRLGHGTSVAIGMTGACQTCLISVNVMDAQMNLTIGSVVDALDLLIAQKQVRFVNMSLGFRADAAGSDAICAKIAELDAAGFSFLIFAAAGNLGPDVPMYPAACDSESILAVASDETSSGFGDVAGQRPIGVGRVEYLLLSVRPLIELGQLQDALPLLFELRELVPADAEIAHSTAAVLFHLGRTPEAYAHASAARDLGRREAGLTWLLALTAANLNKRAETLDLLRELVADHPDQSEARVLLAKILASDEDLQSILQKHFTRDE